MEREKQAQTPSLRSSTQPIHVICTLHEFQGVDLENRLSARCNPSSYGSPLFVHHTENDLLVDEEVRFNFKEMIA